MGTLQVRLRHGSCGSKFPEKVELDVAIAEMSEADEWESINAFAILFGHCQGK